MITVLKEICSIQDVPENNYLVFFSRRSGKNNSSVEFKIGKEKINENWLTEDECFSLVERKIKEHCDSVENDEISIQEACHQIARLTRRGMGKRYGNYIAYKGSHFIDSGIVIARRGEEYCPVFPEGWENYYKVIV